jgi:hypothetical protein
MRLLKILFLLIGISFFTISCGDGGDGEETQVNPLVSDMRVYKVGDTVTYELTWKYTITGEEWKGEATYLITEEVTNPYGIKCKAYEIAGYYISSGGSAISFRTKELFYQDNQANIYACGKYDEYSGDYIFILDTLSTPNGVKLWWKNPINIGDATSGTIYYQDGSWTDCSFRIIGTETVTTLNGTYETYKASENCSYSNGTTTVETHWLYPSIYDVKRSVLYDNGYEMNLNMKSYSLVQ